MPSSAPCQRRPAQAPRTATGQATSVYGRPSPRAAQSVAAPGRNPPGSRQRPSQSAAAPPPTQQPSTQAAVERSTPSPQPSHWWWQATGLSSVSAKVSSGKASGIWFQFETICWLFSKCGFNLQPDNQDRLAPCSMKTMRSAPWPGLWRCWVTVGR
ncbi:hypothetical protein D3C80_1701180 [compost metagenome]